jgi:hypothetical protein
MVRIGADFLQGYDLQKLAINNHTLSFCYA